MGIQIDLDGPYDETHMEVFGWETCGLVLRMTNPWYDEKRDSDGEHQQWSVDASSMAQANEVVPWTVQGYAAWRRQHAPTEDPYQMPRDWIPFDLAFNTARDFVRTAALRGVGARVSY